MNTQSTRRPIEILLVEDNPDDVRLALEALKEGKVNKSVHAVKDGEAALEFLRRTGQYTQTPKIDLILLDLKLPKKDGYEVLAEIKADPALKQIPVVILTSSKAEEDKAKTQSLHALGYMIKPPDLDQFIEVVASMEELWLGILEEMRRNGENSQ